MLERSEKALRLLCIALAAVLLLELVVKIVHCNPASGLKIPALPTVKAEADSGSETKATNNPAGKAAEAKADSKGTNSLSAGQTNGPGTHLVAKTSTTQEVHVVHRSTKRKGDTNTVVAQQASQTETNTAVSHSHGTNGLAESEAPSAGSNTVARLESGGSSTNAMRSQASKGTNTTAHAEVAMNNSNPSARPGMMGKRGPDLPLPILARVDRVVDSELFGPVFHPMPAGLLGIAGNVAFLRASSGQTGVVKEGDELGGLKLLRIGVNRVLVEEDGQKKELLIFQGLGGQSLLPN